MTNKFTVKKLKFTWKLQVFLRLLILYFFNSLSAMNAYMRSSTYCTQLSVYEMNTCLFLSNSK